MKTTVLKIMCLFAFFTPKTALSQTNINTAFDAIIKFPKAEITEKHVFNKDRETNLKIGQDDIYKFVIPADKFDLIKNVLMAFDKDMASAYVVKKGKNTSNESQVQLYSGESSSDVISVISIDDPGTNYIYELFAPSKSEDPDGNYRYAYGFNYKEDNGRIIGKIVINYATTSEYRLQVQQEAEREKNIKWLADMGEIRSMQSESATQQSWFERVMACVGGMAEASPKTRIALATKVFSLVKEINQYPEVTTSDKDAIREILKAMVSDSRYSESVLNKLLNQCLVELK